MCPHPSDPTTARVRNAEAGDATILDWLVRRFSPLPLAQARYRVARHRQSIRHPEDLVQRIWLVCLDRIGTVIARNGRRTPTMLRFLSTLLQICRNLLRWAFRRSPGAAGNHVR